MIWIDSSGLIDDDPINRSIVPSVPFTEMGLGRRERDNSLSKDKSSGRSSSAVVVLLTSSWSMVMNVRQNFSESRWKWSAYRLCDIAELIVTHLGSTLGLIDLDWWHVKSDTTVAISLYKVPQQEFAIAYITDSLTPSSSHRPIASMYSSCSNSLSPISSATLSSSSSSSVVLYFSQTHHR